MVNVYFSKIKEEGVIPSKNVEDAANATFLYKNGISGILNVNWSDESYRKPTNKIEILGSKGKILADQHGIKIFLKKSLQEYYLHVGWNTIYITDVFKTIFNYTLFLFTFNSFFIEK